MEKTLNKNEVLCVYAHRTRIWNGYLEAYVAIYNDVDQYYIWRGKEAPNINDEILVHGAAGLEPAVVVAVERLSEERTTYLFEAYQAR